MDEELQKRNPDCIYFLASPLTCKKGIECEYRHSEIARLNPRDCWYWLAGSCLNPSCAFRHPPLDARTELTSKSAHPQYQCSTDVKEVNVPCYFYFSGFCNKGDRCSFLHGPDDATPASKVLKTVSVVRDIPHLENKPSAGSDARSAHMGKLPNQSEADPNRSLGSQVKPEEDFNPSTFGNIECHSASPHTSTSECQEAPVAMSDTLLDREGCSQIGSLMSSDQNSGEQVIGHMQEDWLESSPGFDVLIDDRCQNLGYEDDAEYLLAINKDDRQLNDLFSGCDHYYEDTEECAEFLLEQERLDFCDELDDEERFEIVREIPTSLKENTMNSILPRNRKFFPVDLELDGHRGADLRFHLWKRRAVDGSQLTHFSKRNSFSQKIYQSHELSRQYGRHKFCIGSLGKNKTRFRTTNSSGWFRQSRSDIPRQRREKRQSKRPFYSSDISRRPVARRRLNEENTKFSGPKTLDQIKEEKRKGTGNGDSSDHLRHMSRISGDFEGPKPLSEILKDKKKLCSVADNNGCS